MYKSQPLFATGAQTTERRSEPTESQVIYRTIQSSPQNLNVARLETPQLRSPVMPAEIPAQTFVVPATDSETMYRRIVEGLDRLAANIEAKCDSLQDEIKRSAAKGAGKSA